MGSGRWSTDVYDAAAKFRAATGASPFAHTAAELGRGPARHGSCGIGAGETARYSLEHPADAPRAGDRDAPGRLVRKLTLLRDRLRDRLTAEYGPAAAAPLAAVPLPGLAAAYREFAGRVRLTGREYLGGELRKGPVIFEGAQGVLLDEWHGFHPYTTWSTTTFAAETAGAPVVLESHGPTRLNKREPVTRPGRR
ncbi:MAG TPA: adenylosuccinate synthetase [Streptosporangiaceae bacterium]